jgi:hypothetical protein
MNLEMGQSNDRFEASTSMAASGLGRPFWVGVGKPAFADPRISMVSFQRAWRTPVPGRWPTLVAGCFRDSDLRSSPQGHSVRIDSGFGRLGSRHLHHRYRNLDRISMKTTLDLNDQLLADAKALAAQQRTSLTRLVEEGLQLRLRAKVASAKKGRFRLPVFKGRGGLVTGVDPLSNKSLLDALGDDA